MNSNNFSKSFTYFNLFFYMGMVISYTVMPLYFKEENSIVAYGFAYSSMALAGALSLFYGKLIDKYDWKKTIIIGTLIYGFAIFGRLLTDVYSSIFFGFMAGLGASVVLLSIRSWMVESSDENLKKLVFIRNINIQFSTFIGIFLVLLFSLYENYLSNIYFYLIAASPILILISHIIFINYIQKNKKSKNAQKAQEVHKKNKIEFTLIINLILISSIISGICTGLLKPYIILILIDQGLSSSYSLLVYMVITLIQILSTFYLLNNIKRLPVSSINVLIYIELILFLIYLSMYFIVNYQISIYLFILMFIIRSIALAFSSSFEEILHYDVINKEIIASTLGFVQTFFLIGDSLGALISTLAIKGNYIFVFIFLSFFIFINLIVLFKIKSIIKEPVKNYLL
ncbi:MFS transporter [Priestia endophytica]